MLFHMLLQQVIPFIHKMSDVLRGMLKIVVQFLWPELNS